MGDETPVVWISHKDGERCAGCGDDLGSGRFIQINRESGIRCMKCAGYGDLMFLASGNAALTRRATALSARHAVVVKFSRARKRNERQGVLVEEQAVERAQAACAADEAPRAEARQRRQVRDRIADEVYKERFAAEILRLFPGCPHSEADEIARHACEKYSGRVGRSASAKEFEPKAVELAVRARIRHRYTKYEELLSEGLTVAEARAEIRPDLDRICAEWRSGGAGDSIPAEAGAVVSLRIASFDAASIRKEVAYIVDQAGRGMGKLVGFGPLVFFSTGDGDAWVLDREDGLATRLAGEGMEMPPGVREVGSKVAIEWNGRFELQDDDFVFIDRRGQVRRFEGYPVEEIRRCR